MDVTGWKWIESFAYGGWGDGERGTGITRCEGANEEQGLRGTEIRESANREQG